MSYPAWLLESDHIKRGYRQAGYHYYVRRNGEIVALRPLSMKGAHVKGYNGCSIGVCYEGGLSPAGIPTDTRTASQKRALIRLLLTLHLRFAYASIVGHRDLSPDRNGDGVDSRTKCNREEELGEKFERGDVAMFLPGSVVE